jgi:hypothetical protein
MAQQPDEREVFRVAFDIRREREKLSEHLSWKEAMKIAREKISAAARSKAAEGPA